MTKRNGLRRALACLMVLILGVAGILPALAEERVFAADMRMEHVDGEVRLSNKKGKTVSYREGMKLYDGYSIATGEKSYAYIKLDEDKVVKLDANTQVDVHSSNKKLELYLNMGKLFFNVESPLKEDEAFSIRTSTMVTGIRGTSGFVSCENSHADDLWRTIVAITDGVVTWQAGRSVTYSGEQSGEIAAGELNVFTREGGKKGDVQTRKIEAADIPGFVAQFLAEHPALAQKIAEETGLSVQEIVDGAADRLAQDEETAAPEFSSFAVQNGKTSYKYFEANPTPIHYDTPNDPPAAPVVTAGPSQPPAPTQTSAPPAATESTTPGTTDSTTPGTTDSTTPGTTESTTPGADTTPSTTA